MGHAIPMQLARSAADALGSHVCAQLEGISSETQSSKQSQSGSALQLCASGQQSVFAQLRHSLSRASTEQNPPVVSLVASVVPLVIWAESVEEVPSSAPVEPLLALEVSDTLASEVLASATLEVMASMVEAAEVSVGPLERRSSPSEIAW
jgi:hypothetical protein